MTASQEVRGWWGTIREMAERRRRDEGKTTGILVMGEAAFDALWDILAPWDCDEPVMLGGCRFEEAVANIGFLDWQVLIMDDGDLVPDVWFDEP